MQNQKKDDQKTQEIVDEINSMSYDELVEGHEAYERAEDKFHKNRMPLYVIVGVAFLIGLVNGLYIDSGVVFLMCLIFGGGTFVYLYITRHNGPALPKTNARHHKSSRKNHDR